MSSPFLSALLILAMLAPTKPTAASPLRVFVAAPRNFLLNEQRIFRAKGEPLPHDALLKDLGRRVEIQLGKKAWIQVANARELAKDLAGRKEYGDGLLLGREWLNLGQEHYESLRVDDAVTDLHRAEEAYRKVFHDAVEPFSFSRVFLLQGLCYLEQNQKGQSHVALRQMFFLNPWVRFDPGYYPSHAEEELRSAATDFAIAYPKDQPFADEARLAGFLQTYPFDHLVYLYLDDSGSGARVHLVVYGRGNPTPLVNDVIPVGADDERTAATVDAALSRWLSCQDLQPPEVLSKDSGRFGFWIASNHSTYLTKPSRSHFYNLGYGLGAFYRLNRWVEVTLASELYTSILDRYRDLQQNFNTVRGLGGVTFRFGTERVQAIVSPTLEVHYLGDFQIVTDPLCKLYGTGPNSPCDKSSIFSLDLNVLFGMNLAVGGRFYVTKHIFLQIVASVSTYFLPFNRVIDLNFPISGGIGLGYRL